MYLGKELNALEKAVPCCSWLGNAETV